MHATMRSFVSDILIAQLKLLGGYDWLRWRSVEERGTAMDLGIPPGLPLDVYR
jgi:hypothetical protein